MEVSQWAPEKEITQIEKVNGVCVTKKNNYKQIAVIPEELIDKPEN